MIPLAQEHEIEPVRGLPGRLPPGEEILWQGTPDWRVLARTALYTRWVAGYFALLVLWSLVSSGSIAGIAATIVAGVLAVGLLYLFAWAVARSTIYTLTNKRVVLRIGVALSKCVNLPLTLVRSADLRPHAGGVGDVALEVGEARLLGYALLWPHARPWRIARPAPMLRAIPDAERVGAMIARATSAMASIERSAPQATPAAIGPLQEAAA